MSDYYKDYEPSPPEKAVQYPLYTGHFQPDHIDNAHFSDIAANLALYGWGNQSNQSNQAKDLYWTFMAVNNANVDVNCHTNSDHSLDSSTFQGLVSDTRDGNHTATDKDDSPQTLTEKAAYTKKITEDTDTNTSILTVDFTTTALTNVAGGTITIKYYATPVSYTHLTLPTIA